MTVVVLQMISVSILLSFLWIYQFFVILGRYQTLSRDGTDETMLQVYCVKYAVFDLYKI